LIGERSPLETLIALQFSVSPTKLRSWGIAAANIRTE
jgi:hypothetical protein